MLISGVNTAFYDYSERIMKTESPDWQNRIHVHKVKETTPVTKEIKTVKKRVEEVKKAERAEKAEKKAYDNKQVENVEQIDGIDSNKSASSRQNFDFSFLGQGDRVLLQTQELTAGKDTDISAAQEDSVLDQYRYFVKPNLGTDEDGAVRQLT